jgi:hypothetical protein
LSPSSPSSQHAIVSVQQSLPPGCEPTCHGCQPLGIQELVAARVRPRNRCPALLINCLRCHVVTSRASSAGKKSQSS